MGIATFADDKNRLENSIGSSAVSGGTFSITCSSDKNAVQVVDSKVIADKDFETAVNFSEFIDEEFGESDGELKETYSDKSVCVLALPFGETYDFGMGTITFDKNAFDETLADIGEGGHYFYLAADGHTLDAMYLLARSDIKEGPGSVKAMVNDRGLWLIGQFADTQAGRDTFELIQRGVLTKASVGITINDEYDDEGEPINYQMTEEDGKYHYEYKKVSLDETSFVARPAFTGTDIKPLNSDEMLGEATEAEIAEDGEDVDTHDNDFITATKFMLSELAQITKDNAALTAENDQLRTRIVDSVSDYESEPSKEVEPLADIAKEILTSKQEVIVSQESALQRFVNSKEKNNG